jgi:pimeloyl-ACP methyl ester carboxylesterase
MKNHNNISFLLFLLLGFSNQAFSQTTMDTTKFGDNLAVGKFIDIRGFKMYYETYGKGEPLLFIHGNGCSINSFVNQIPYFSKNYRVILTDSRAQGKSVDIKDSLSYEMMADDLDALLDNLHLKQIYVIGWSDGGINGLLLAMRHPDKVKKLAVTGANLWPDSTAVSPFIFKQSLLIADSLSKLASTPQVKTQLKLARLLAYQPHIKLEQLHEISCPTLVIGGDHDVILSKHTLEISEAIPNSYLWIIPNSGHATPVFKKDQFNTIINDFFKNPYRRIEGIHLFE